MTEIEYFHGNELRATTWRNKHAAPKEKNPNDMFIRTAKEFARIEKHFSHQRISNPNYITYLSGYYKQLANMEYRTIYNLIKDFGYIVFSGSVNAGIGLNTPVSLSNCFVTAGPNDSYGSIMDTRKNQAQLMKRRGGVGYDLSYIRPRFAIVNNAAKHSTGAASYMEGSSYVTNEVAQDGRRGALMLTISIEHPDSPEFITSKQNLTKVTGANISVKVTDEFMNAVIKDEDYVLRFPLDLDIKPILEDKRPFEYNKLYPLQTKKGAYYKIVKAKELWESLMKCAWATAEPGIIFIDRMHNYSPDGVYPNFKTISTNPCGEIGMGSFDSCRLLHTNYTKFVLDPFTKKARFDWDKFKMVIYQISLLGDDLVELELEAIDRILNKIGDSDPSELQLWETIKKNTQLGRRAGCGFLGLGDMLAMLGLKYGTSDADRFIDILESCKTTVQLVAQNDMAITRGSFPSWDRDSEMEIIQTSDKGTTLVGKNDWFKTMIAEFPSIMTTMFNVGRRNISWSTVAPTGTVSMFAGVSSGIEPVFLPFYDRKRKCMTSEDRVDFIDQVGEKFTIFVVVHPMLIEWAMNYYNLTREEVDSWTLDMWEDRWKLSPYYGATAQEINWLDRIKLQGVIQKYITHSISSTVNLPQETTQKEIEDLYIIAWKHGLKGITIYRDKCRDGILTKIEKPSTIEGREAPKRPKELEADAYLVKVKGEQFIILIGLLEGKPYEIFTFRPLNNIDFKPHKGTITKVKKMHYSFHSDHLHIDNLGVANSNVEENAATLYSSMLLRHGVNLEYIIKTAKKVNDNISSFSSAMCRIISKYIGKTEIKGEVCPDCGGRLVRENGCIHCLDCGYSKCL